MSDATPKISMDFTPALTSVVEGCDCRVKLNDPASSVASPGEPDVGGIPLRRFDDLVRAIDLDVAAAATSKESRAYILRKRRIFGTCLCSRMLIMSVHDFGILGCTLQANLDGPPPPEPRIHEELVREFQRQFPAKPKRKRSRDPRPRQPPFFEI